MEVTVNKLLTEEIIERLRKKFGLYTKAREGIHESDLIYCPVIKYHSTVVPLPPTTKEVGLFARGLGLEKVLLEDDDDVHRPESITLDNIMVSIDHTFNHNSQAAELKTTSMYFKAGELAPNNGWPDGWIKQMMNYTYVQSKGLIPNIAPSLTYNLCVFGVGYGDINSRTFTFTQEEIDTNWAWMLWRRDRLQEAYDAKLQPEPYAYVTIDSKGKRWECERCAYQMFCAVAKSTGRYVHAPSN